jgi:hypothetical protein
MTNPELPSDAEVSKRHRNHAYMLTMVLLIAVVVGFMVGRIVESTRHDYMKNAYIQQIQELEQQIADHAKTIDCSNGKAVTGGLGDSMTVNWAYNIDY